MGIIDWLKGKLARDKPVQNLYQFSPPFSFGVSISNQTVNEKTAMTCSAVWACVKIISESIASLPLHVYEYTKTGKEKALKHNLFYLLHSAPNVEMTSFIFFETLMVHLLLWGNAYVQIIKNQHGQVTALYPLPPSNITVERNDNGELQYKYRRYTEENPNFKDKGEIILRREDVLHIVGLGFDGIIGYSPIAMARNAIGLSLSCERYGGKFFAGGGRPSGVLTMPTLLKDEGQIQRLQKSWHSQYSGDNEGMTPILEQGMKYEAISIPPQDAQFLESRKFQLAEIARIFRVPLHLLNDLDRATFSNIEQQSLEYVIYTLTPYVSRLEQAMNKALFTDKEHGRYFVKFNLSGLLRGDYKSRMDGYAVGRQNGWLSTNDIRELEDLNLIDAKLGGDEYLINGNFMKLSQAGAAYQKEGDKK